MLDIAVAVDFIIVRAQGVVVTVIPDTNAGGRGARVEAFSGLSLALFSVPLLCGWDHASFISSLGSLITAVLGELIGDSNRVRGVGRSTKRLAATTRSDKRHLLQSQGKCTHELRTAGGADRIVMPVGLVSDGNIEQKLVEVTDTANANAKIRLEVTSVLGLSNELLHLEAEKFNVLE
jgi:hypothetical protein